MNQKQERGDDLNDFQDEEQLVKPVENGDGEEEATVKRNKNNHGIHKCQTIRKNHILLKINMDLMFLEFF